MGKKLAVLASGNGSGFEAIYNAVKDKQLDCSIEVVISNNSNAVVLDKAETFNIDHYVVNESTVSKEQSADELLDKILDKYNCDYIFLSGYMKKIPVSLVKKYNKKIINSHPSLLPKFGGKGMYGRFVHEAVINSNEKKSGVTIHYVNEVYDEGEIILQDELEISADDTALSLEKKIKKIEKKAIVKALQKVIN